MAKTNETKKQVAERKESLPEGVKSPLEVIQDMAQKGVTPEVISKFLDQQERFEANQARKAYHVAMTNFKESPPEINKDKKVAYKDVKYNHASLANVTKKINEALSKHGLAASWVTKQDNGQVTVTCRITHVKGHSEQTSLTAGPDNTGSKNAIQAIGSTVVYLQRYTILALTGLATYESDNDGGAPMEYINEEEQQTILDNLHVVGGKIEKLLKYLGVDSLDKLPKSDLKKALSVIAAAKERKEQQK